LLHLVSEPGLLRRLGFVSDSQFARSRAVKFQRAVRVGGFISIPS
jgi:hypothetical protein